jgi:hypothetical protein
VERLQAICDYLDWLPDDVPDNDQARLEWHADGPAGGAARRDTVADATPPTGEPMTAEAAMRR